MLEHDMSRVVEHVARLNHGELVDAIGRLARETHVQTACLLIHLGEMDHRGLHVELGCASLFAYVTQALGFSEAAAYKRIAVARAHHVDNIKLLCRTHNIHEAVRELHVRTHARRPQVPLLRHFMRGLPLKLTAVAQVQPLRAEELYGK